VRATVSLAVASNFWQAKADGATPSAIAWKAADGTEIDPAGAPQRSFKLAPARDQCPGVRAFAGKIVELRPQDDRPPTRTAAGFRMRVTVLGRFQLER
jgi:hypothetical protein